MLRPTSIALLVLAGTALAQVPPTHISPKSATSGLGNSNNNIPFSWTPTGYQQVHSLASFSSTSPVPFTKMSLRMGSGFTNRPGFQIDVELAVANSTNDSNAASAVFNLNEVPGSRVAVFTRKGLNLVAVPNNDWVVTFPFDNFFIYTGQTHLSWSAAVYGNTNGNALFTYPLDAWWKIGQSSRTGSFAGCSSAAGGTRAASHSVSTVNLRPGGVANFTGNSYVPAGGLPALMAIGGSSTNYGGLPLPYDMSGIGATGCSVTNDILLTLAGVTNANANGDVVIPLAVPANPALSGVTFYSQFYFLQSGANPLGLFTSNGQTNRVGTDPLVTRIYAIGNPSATSGTLDTGYGMAVGFN